LPSSLDDLFVPYTSENFLLSAFVLALFVLLAVPRLARVQQSVRNITSLFAAVARHKTHAILALFFAVVAVRVALLHVLPVPLPGIHDEFSHLLLADTLAHGRLTNPTHPLWRSFETFHENWLPTYASIYPPAQGTALAIGQVLGHPWLGVLLSNAAMCAAILWMLQSWMPPKWALLGALLVVLKLGFTSYWMNSYWGGAVAAIGGALVLGALPRIKRHARCRDALALAAGIAILANSRPYEGSLFCLPVAVWFLWWLIKGDAPGIPQAIRIRRVLLPVALALACNVGAMAYYNWRVTAHPLVFPYTLNLRTYVTSPIFLWQHAKPALHYNNQVFEDFYNGWEREDYQRGWAGALDVSLVKWTRLRSVFFWPATLALLPMIVFLFRDRRMRLPLIILLVCTPGLFIIVWSNPHYAAPLTCVIFALLTQALRHLSKWKVAHRPVGAALSFGIVALLVLQVGGEVHARKCDELTWACTGDSSRFEILDRLKALPGKHLVIVRYEQDHNIHDEWVFNGAEIDSAKVLWARELDPAQNAALLNYFSDRTIWLVDPDADNLDLEPYPAVNVGAKP
jgi:hypothetical protein